ncbi:hypothetical protein OROMI_031454 [Orobanche minor]
MALYRRFMVDAFRLQKYVSTITFSHRSSSSNSRSSGFLKSFVSNSQRYKNPFVDGSKRFFKPKGFKFWSRLLGCGVVTTSAYYWNLERVPYTKRSHLVLFSTRFEKEYWGFDSLKMIKSDYEGKILPPLHPTSVRVQRIGQEIVEAAEKGLRKEEECLIVKIFKKLGKRDYHQIPQFEWEFLAVDEPTREAGCYAGGKIVVYTGWQSDAEIAAVIGHEVGHAITRHTVEFRSRLLGFVILNLFLIYWTINLHLVPTVSKFLSRLPYSRRQSAEKVYRLRCPAILMFLCWKYNLSLITLIGTISGLLIILPYSRRQEKEADYIGLILVALAGYDPRIVVELRENCEYNWPLSEDYLHSHPSNKKRAQLLSQPKVMEEALSLYGEVLAQRNVTEYQNTES